MPGLSMTGDPWLLELGMQGERQRNVARQVLTASIQISKRWGHVLCFADKETRRTVQREAERGNVAQVRVPCARCGIEPRLNEWLAASTLSELGARRLAENAYNTAQEGRDRKSTRLNSS